VSEVLRRAQASDREALIALWMQAFGDTREEVERFLQVFACERTAYVLCEDGWVCSMLFVLPTAVQDGNHRFAAGYIYAGATRADARSKGYYRRLLAYVAQAERDKGTAALLLRPATDRLADSYRRMGFTVPLYGNTDRDAKIPSGDALDARTYAALRRERLRGQAFVDWDDRTLQYALSWCRAYTNGEHLMLCDGNTVWEYLPAVNQTETALLMPLAEDCHFTASIWFGYGLE